MTFRLPTQVNRTSRSLQNPRTSITRRKTSLQASSSSPQDSSREPKATTKHDLVNLIKTADDLVPYSRNVVNMPMLVWQAIADAGLRNEDRVRLLTELSGEDIERLWRLAAGETRDQRTMEYRIWDDLPTEDGTPVTFRARRTSSRLPLWYTFGLRGDSGDDSEDIIGFVDGIVSRASPRIPILAPLLRSSQRFRATVGTQMVGAGTCDCVLEFDCPAGGKSKDMRNTLEYVRVAGPGVLVSADPAAGRFTLLVKSPQRSRLLQ